MGLPVEVNSLLLGSGDYLIERSLRLRANASPQLSRTLTTASTSSTICTWSAWVKRGALGASRANIAYNGNTAGNGNMIVLEFASDTIRAFFDGGIATVIQTTALYRDPTAWYHIVLNYDSTQATASNRVRLFVNGSQITSFSSASYPSLNQAFNAGNTNVQYIGNGGASPCDGYFAEVHFIDGQSLPASSFGRTDPVTGVWMPRRYTGTYGTNGTYLKFTNNSAATATTIGRDFSGNGNNFTPTNISVTAGTTFDSMFDSPTNYGDRINGRGNYATWNPLDVSSSTISAGNLDVSIPFATTSIVKATAGVSSGKWYWETTITGGGLGAAGILVHGTAESYYPGYTSADGISYNFGGTVYRTGAIIQTYTSFTTNDIIGIALDLDNGRLYFSKNGVWQGGSDPATDTRPAATTNLTGRLWFPANGNNSASAATHAVNFGQRPFAYTPPTGFLALNTQNLPTPIIQNGARHFDVATYTGTGASRSITGELFSPDLVWIKSRSAATDHALYDTTRGVQLQLESNSTTAETTETTGLTAFNSDGFTIGALAQVNTNTATYVAWQWDEGVTPGFDVVTYTGTGSALNVSHNLGAVPRLMLIKARNNTVADHWGVYHGSLPNTQNLYLNLTNAAATASMWNSTSPTSSVFTVGANNDVNRSTLNYVAYLWSEVPGFSRFGSYTGNGSTDGPFIWCGFRPRWVMFKRTDTTGDWVVFDTARAPANTTDLNLTPNAATVERTDGIGNSTAGFPIDILSNGFKQRSTGAARNASGGTYVFAAFAENPFKIARAR